MAVEILTYKPPERKKEKPLKRASRVQASRMLRRKIEKFLKSSDKRHGDGLFYFDSGNDVVISDGNPKSRPKVIERRMLQDVALEVMKGYGLNENKFSEDIRPETDPIDFKVSKGSYIQYRVYPTRLEDLAFERMVVVRNDHPQQVKWDIEGTIMRRARSR